MQTINFEIQRKFEVTQYPFYVHAHGSYYMFPCYDYSIEVDNNGIKKSTLNLKEILNCYQSIPATQDQQEARRLFDKALSDAAQTLNQYLPKSYFLFGMKAVEYREREMTEEDNDLKASKP